MSLGVIQLAARLLWIIYDDLTYMPGILAYLESGILAEGPGRLDLGYFLSLHLVSGTLYAASWQGIQTSYSKVRAPRDQGRNWQPLQILGMDLA